jgi:hypothetical protein
MGHGIRRIIRSGYSGCGGICEQDQVGGGVPDFVGTGYFLWRFTSNGSYPYWFSFCPPPFAILDPYLLGVEPTLAAGKTGSDVLHFREVCSHFIPIPRTPSRSFQDFLQTFNHH